MALRFLAKAPRSVSDFADATGQKESTRIRRVLTNPKTLAGNGSRPARRFCATRRRPHRTGRAPAPCVAPAARALRRLCNAALLCFRYRFFRAPEPETGTGFYFHEHNLPAHAPHIGRIGRDRRCPAYHIEFKPPEPVISLENAVSDRFQIRRGNVFASAAYVLFMSGHTDALLRGLSSRRTAPDAVRSNRKPSLPGIPRPQTRHGENHAFFVP